MRYCTDLYDTASYTKSKFAYDTFGKEKAAIECHGRIQSLADIHEKHTGDDMLKKRLAPLALLTIALTAAGSAGAQASAQNFPNKPIHIIVTFSSGGTPDIIARLISDRMSTEWGNR